MSAAKRSPPFRAEHVGSLLRPDELVQKRYAVAAGKADASELKPIEDKAVTEVVKLQKDCGFHAVSSGEYTRYVLSPLSEDGFTCMTSHVSLPSIQFLPISNCTSKKSLRKHYARASKSNNQRNSNLT